MSGPWRSPIWVGLVCVALSGSCSLLAPSAVEARKETLTKVPAELPHGKTHPGTLLVRTLQDGACFSTVVTPPFMGHYTHALRTQILTLLQDFTAEPPTLQLTLRFQLITAGGDEPVATREISIHEPMREKSPYAGAVAANDATAKAL